VTTGLVGSIQDYSTKDGPGLRSTVFLKGCNLACKWCANPELISFDENEVFFPERIKDPDLALAENEGALERAPGGWRLARGLLPAPAELIERSTQMIFDAVATRMSVDECVDRLLRNRVFYETSGGGVTFSGGEALIQVGFVSQCLNRLKEQGIHTAIDTAGNVPWGYFARVVDRTDLFPLRHQGHRRGRAPPGHRRVRPPRPGQRPAARRGREDHVDPPRGDPRLERRRRRSRGARPLRRLPRPRRREGRCPRLTTRSASASTSGLGMDYELSEIPAVDEALIDSVLELGRELGLAIEYEPGVQAAARRTSVRGRTA